MGTREDSEPNANDGAPRHAGLGPRIWAALLDVVIMGVPVGLIVLIIYREQIKDAGLISTPNFVNIALLAVITILLWVNWDGRTPGKKLLRIRIVSHPEHRNFSYGTATIRTLLSLTGALTLGVGYVVQASMIGSRPDNRGYHDLAARTCVVHDD